MPNTDAEARALAESMASFPMLPDALLSMIRKLRHLD